MDNAKLTQRSSARSAWKSQSAGVYQLRTLIADAPIANCYLAGASTRHLRRALSALFAAPG